MKAAGSVGIRTRLTGCLFRTNNIEPAAHSDFILNSLTTSSRFSNKNMFILDRQFYLLIQFVIYKNVDNFFRFHFHRILNKVHLTEASSATQGRELLKDICDMNLRAVSKNRLRLTIDMVKL